ncbi:putative sugar transporter, partial [Haloferax larsenii JCM 13917]
MSRELPQLHMIIRVGPVRERVNRNDRAIVALVMLAHGMVHTYELSIPIFVSIWLSEYTTVELGLAAVPVLSLIH